MSANQPQQPDTSLQNVWKAIDENRDALQRPGVLSVEPGRLFENGWITLTPAIVVTVARKIPRAALALDELLPRRLGGFRVEVVQADPLQQLAALPPEVASANAFPDFGLEVADIKLRYERLPGNPIDEVFEISRPLLCHASPDAGWPTLKKFLSGVNDRLTVSMYDFNADYIARDLILAAQSSGAQIDLVLDPKRDQEERQIQQRLEQRLTSNYTMTVASLGDDGLFDSAYHEKVAVRDGRAFWLSSGNWSVSSLPNIDPFGPEPPSGNIYGLGNRDWHVIVQNSVLARLFERYIQHDRDSSAGAAPSDAIMPDLLIPQDVFADTLAPMAEPPPPVAPRALPRPERLPVRVRPLLTPDNYIGHIHTLIEEAEESLCLQLQYIHPSRREGDEEFARLIELVSARTNQANFNTRIIIGHRQAAMWVKEMRDNWGFDVSKVRVQYRVHNKGIIVDGNKVVVGSHNWSGDGTLRNRDASLIIYDEEVAQYYQNIFDNDWQFLARQNVQEELTPTIALPGEPTPPGMVRVSWNDYFSE